MQKTTYTTTRFDIGKNFFVEINYNTKNEVYDFVLCHEEYGVKMHMLGLMTKDAPENSWEDIIRTNIDKYVQIYTEEYIEDVC